MRKKKLFIYIHQCILKGGVEKVFFNLLNNLPENQYDITVLSHIAYLTDDLYAGLYPDHVRRRWLYYDEFSSGGVRRLMQRIHNFLMPRLYPIWLRLCRFDTAIAAQEGMYARFVDENIRSRNKLLWIHNDMSICHWTGNHFDSEQDEAQCYRRFNRVVCVSQAVAQSMESVFGSMHNLCVCYNPIDTNEIDQKRTEFPVMRENVPLFIAVGRLADQKGFDRLLRVCRRLNQAGYDYRVWILGEGEKRPELEAEISKGGLENVQLLGNQSNPFPFMNAADWLICTSRHEGFSTALQEAVWCYLPIITMDTSGATELLGNNQYGIVTDNDEDSFFAAMCQVLSNPELLGKYRNAVQKRRDFIDLPGRIEAICKLL